jgi:hypothetical protein
MSWVPGVKMHKGAVYSKMAPLSRQKTGLRLKLLFSCWRDKLKRNPGVFKSETDGALIF